MNLKIYKNGFLKNQKKTLEKQQMLLKCIPDQNIWTNSSCSFEQKRSVGHIGKVRLQQRTDCLKKKKRLKELYMC